MILDLNKILFYANGDGTLRTDHPQNAKTYLSIVDGIYAGEGSGPLSPDKREVGLLFAGTNPVAVDCACATMMSRNSAVLYSNMVSSTVIIILLF